MNGMLHIIQNDPEVPPGNLIDHLTVSYLVHHPYCGDKLPIIADIAALIVLGGRMGANDDQEHPFLVKLKELIRAVVEAEIPYLGICLGGQLLAAAMGAEVVSNRWEELGTLRVSLTVEGKTDQLFNEIPATFQTFQWHHDSFDLPEGALLLATSAACSNQAFRIGRCAWGLQFHPEVTPEIIGDWCAWDPATASSADELIAEFLCQAVEYRATSQRLLGNFLQSATLS